MFARRTRWDLTANAFAQALARRRASGAALLDLTASNPTEAGLAYASQDILAALTAPESLRYQPEPMGLPVARAAVARYYAELPGAAATDAAGILITTSTSEAYSFCFRLLCDPGDEVLVPRPSYPLFELLAGIQDVSPVHYPLYYDHGWHMDLAALREAITPRTRAVAVVHPNNPTGSGVSAAEREALNELCLRHELALLADEVFLDYAHGAPPVSFAANQDALTFTMSGLSKIAGLPQMKVAWMVASGPPTLRESALARLEVIADTYLSPNAPLQWALPRLLETRHGFQAALTERLRHNLSVLDRLLGGQALVSRLALEAGWYAILRVPALGADEDLAVRLIEREGVVVHPGHFFDFPQDGHLVVSLMTPPVEYEEGLRRLLGAVAGG
jgi:alanine-synthesizing transaminase